jgi:hypothetical protein
MIIKSLNVNIVYLFLGMEKKEATKVGCSACKKKGNSKFNLMVFLGFLFSVLSVYGLISIIIDIVSLF